MKKENTVIMEVEKNVIKKKSKIKSKRNLSIEYTFKKPHYKIATATYDGVFI